MGRESFAALEALPMNMRTLFFLSTFLGVWLPNGFADVKVTVDHNSQSSATAAFQFKQVPQPSRNDAATTATFSLVDGQRDQNGGDLGVLQDGRLPREEDEPERNFFYSQGSTGGRIRIDLGRAIPIKEVNSYSWHSSDRGPQVYKLFASDGKAAEFKAEPKGVDPLSCGWTLVATVNTRPEEGTVGGQHGVRIADSDAERDLGPYRYLLFDISRTESRDPFGNTFFSEIDVVERDVPPLAAGSTNDLSKPITNTFTAEGGRYQFILDTTVAPDLTEWATNQLRPVVEEWYPKLVALLPSEGWVARSNVTIRFRDNMGRTPASAGGGFINCNAGWFRRELKREARGSVVHEMVHVVQSYGRVPRDDPSATRMPGWLVEGIPDYIRWFIYEPQTKGAEITANNFARAKYDASYRVTGNFLNWVTQKYDTNVVQKLNAAARAGKFREDLWKEYTGKTVQELGEEWKRFHQDRLGIKSEDKPAEESKKETPAKL
jgi:hypothetical protein